MGNVIFMIESGKALALVKHHISEVLRVRNEVGALLEDLGVRRYRLNRVTGVLSAVDFDGAQHPDFKKPTKWGSYPKKGTEWAKRFAEQRGHESDSGLISDAFSIPLSLSYRSEDSSGGRCIGSPLTECGFLYLSVDGPYAMWVPDVPAEVAYQESLGYTVDEPAKSFRLEFDGCRRIEPEEWDILVAQHKLDQKRAA